MVQFKFLVLFLFTEKENAILFTINKDFGFARYYKTTSKVNLNNYIIIMNSMVFEGV